MRGLFFGGDMAGKRHSADDQARINSIVQSAIDLGADHPRLAAEVAEAVADIGPKSLTFDGGAVKALGNGRIGGPLVRFTKAGDYDLTGDRFDEGAYFGESDTAPVYYNHGLDETLGRRVLGKAKLEKRPDMIWAETQLAMRDEYERAIYALAEAGKLGWSSGTAAHLVERATEADGKGHVIKSWPIAEASLTPTPAEFRNSALTLKSLLAAVETAGQPAPDGAPQAGESIPTPAAVAAEGATKRKEAPKMSENTTPQAVQPDNTVLDAIKALASQVEALKAAAPVEKTPGVAGMLAEGKAPAQIAPALKPNDEQHLELTRLYAREIDVKTWRTTADKNVDRRKEADLMRRAALDPQAFRSELKAVLDTTTDSAGGYLVPVGYSNVITAALMESSVIRQAGATQFAVAGTDSFRFPTLTRTSSAASAIRVTESGSFGAIEPTFGEVEFNPFKYGFISKATEEVLADSRVPVANILVQNAAYQFVQAENSLFATGAGTAGSAGVPNGLVTGASASGSTAASASFSYLDLLQTYHALPYMYRGDAAWFMSDTTIATVRRITEIGGSGNLLWQPGLQAGQPDRLLGRPVYTVNAMSSWLGTAAGSGTRIIAFGDPRYYYISDFNAGGTEFKPLNELYAASGQVGWRFQRRFDGNLMLSEAMQVLLHR